MKKAVLIHGYHAKYRALDENRPTPSNGQWLPWLSKQLYIRDIFPIAIEMPQPWRPVYEDWKCELERFELDEDMILIGHSYGAGFLVRYLSENNLKINKVFLVAPYMGFPEDNEVPEQDPSFFQFDIDKKLVAKTKGVTIFGSTDDMNAVQETIKLLKKTINDLKVITVENAGHFCISDGYAKFPELLKEILA